MASPFEVPGILAHWEWSRVEPEILSAAMRSTKFTEWERLYKDARVAAWIKPGLINELIRLEPDDAVELIGVVSLNGYGYSRERAMVALGELKHPRAVPYTLLRLSDWVPEVGLAAVATLRILMAEGIAEELVEHAGLVDRLLRFDSPALNAVHSDIGEYLRTRESRDALLNGTRSAVASRRRFCFDLLACDPNLKAEVVARAAIDSEPQIRRWLAEKIVKGEIDPEPSVFERLLEDPAAAVSTLAIRSLGPEQVEQYRVTLSELALSKSRRVRAAARWKLGAEHRDEIAFSAREAIRGENGNRLRAGVLDALGETGDPGDFELATGFATHDQPGIRASAIYALSRLDADRALPFMIHALDDSHGRVRRNAFKFLRHRSRSEWVEPATRVLNHGTIGARKNALRLLLTQGGWENVLAAFYALTSDEPSLRDLGWTALREWYMRDGTKGWVRPTAACRGEMARIWSDQQKIGEPPQWVRSIWPEVQRCIVAAVDPEGL